MEVGATNVGQRKPPIGLENLVSQEMSEQVMDELDERKKNRKKSSHVEASTASEIANRKNSIKSLKKDSDNRKSQKSKDNPYYEKELNFEDTVELTKIKWQKNAEGQVDIQPNIETPLMSSVDLKYEAREILRTKGHEIDILGQLPRLKQSFIQNYIQSKSANVFVSKYAAFKVGVIGQTLTMLGVSSEDLIQLKKKAHRQAINENVELMGETIYNQELMALVHGVGRKTKQSRQLLAETQQKLIGQMNALGKGHYWDEARLLEEKIKQLDIISEEFRRDHRALSYQYEFMIQEVSN